MGIETYSENPSENGHKLVGVNVAENCPPSEVNNGIRKLMSDIKTYSLGITAALAGKLGKTENAVSASKLNTARQFSLSGVTTAPAQDFDGTGNIVLTTSIANATLSIAKTSGLQTALNGKQAVIGNGDLSISHTSGLQTALDGKQATIGNNDLSISYTSGLQAALDSKLSSIADGDLTIAKTSGLQAALDSKLSEIADGSLTFAKTSGLQAALDGKLGSSATAANSSQLGGLASASFLRANADDTVTGKLTFNNELLFENGDHRIAYNDGAGNFSFRIGHKSDGGVSYTKANSGAVQLLATHEAATSSFAIKVAPPSVNAGDAVSFTNDLTVTEDLGVITSGIHQLIHEGNADTLLADDFLSTGGGTLDGDLEVEKTAPTLTLASANTTTGNQAELIMRGTRLVTSGTVSRIRFQNNLSGGVVTAAELTVSGDGIVDLTAGELRVGGVQVATTTTSTSNAATATALETARDFSLSGIVTAPAISFDGTQNVTFATAIADAALSIAKTSGLQTALDGKLATNGVAASSTLLETPRNFSLTGVITAPVVAFNGGSAVALSTSIADNALSIAKTSGLQAALDAKEATLAADRKRKITYGTAAPGTLAVGEIYIQHVA